jgi:hypothetical protein
LLKLCISSFFFVLIQNSANAAGCYFPKGMVDIMGQAPLRYGVYDAWIDAKHNAYTQAEHQCKTPVVEVAYKTDSYWKLTSIPIQGGKMGFARNLFGCGTMVCHEDY